AFVVFAAGPIQRSVEAGIQVGDRAVATDFAIAGLEYAKTAYTQPQSGNPYYTTTVSSVVSANPGSPNPPPTVYTDPYRNINFYRFVYKEAVLDAGKRIGWNLSSQVTWYRGSKVRPNPDGPSYDNRRKSITIRTFVAEKMLGM
ncbi:MAG: hypothetical protein ACM3UP_02415, partial [Methanocella sp.]